MDLLALEEALQAQGLQSKASIAKCSSRFYLSTTTVTSSKVNTLIVSSYQWHLSAAFVVSAVWSGRVSCRRLQACTCGSHGILVSRPYGDVSTARTGDLPSYLWACSDFDGEVPVAFSN